MLPVAKKDSAIELWRDQPDPAENIFIHSVNTDVRHRSGGGNQWRHCRQMFPLLDPGAPQEAAGGRPCVEATSPPCDSDLGRPRALATPALRGFDATPSEDDEPTMGAESARGPRRC